MLNFYKVILNDDILREKPKHSYNIDLLRTIAMLMVVIYHSHGMLDKELYISNIIYLYIQSILSSCVPIFFYISGYLMLTPCVLNIRKIIIKALKLLLVSWLWAIIWTYIISIIRADEISLHSVWSKIAITEIGYCNWIWFMNTLFFLYLLAPIFNIILNNKRIYIYICCLLFISSIILPSVDMALKVYNINIPLLYLSRFINPLYAFPAFAMFYFY